MAQGGLRVAVAAFAAVVSVACSTVEFGSDYDRQVSFTQLSTYDLLEPSEEVRDALNRVSPFLERRLRRAVEAELRERGYVRVTDSAPDVWVDAFVVIPGSDGGSGGGAVPGGHHYGGHGGGVGVNLSVGFAFGYPRWGYGYGYPFVGVGFAYPYFGYPFGFGYPVRTFGGYGHAYPDLDGHYPGTLVIDVVDAETNDLIWRGWADEALTEAPAPDEIADYINDVVKRIMEGFPPGG